MKLRALRLGTRDEADAAMLARASGITSREAMVGLLQRYFPAEPPDPRRVLLIARFAETLHAPPSNEPG
ncbi:hypothetical protein [Paracraurococcus lichenis]|uniref:Uncharacterized protein n=1 Tax=Paracraurococcus lichenis TaxID=3064888 RepID=A0ABT9E0L3_9PROT|nr:hypothetical protein [Paracraurococcus sp. LOR1-02]MDO9709668.1 hypothetical protein [Paracraurococcus sp. LOR1-02]